MLERFASGHGSDTERFERAVTRFAHKCIGERARESVFQGWLTAFLAEEFGWCRVYREVHVQACDLLDMVPNQRHFFEQFERKAGQNKKAVAPDVSISDSDRPVDCRSSSTRGEEVAGSDITKRLSIIAELKVTDAVTNPRDQRSSVWRDFKKLALYAAAASTCRESNHPLAAYLIILDNARTTPSYDLQNFASELRKVGTSWLAGVAAPMVIVGRLQNSPAVDFYQKFAHDRTITESATTSPSPLAAPP